MGKKLLPFTAGVVDIAYGVGGIMVGYVFITFAHWICPDPYLMVSVPMGCLLVIFGVLAIIGGIFAIAGKKWLLACAGAIFSLAPSIPYTYSFWRWDYSPDNFFDISTLIGFSGVPAIISIVLTILSRKQFERK